ncbi:MAG: XdhC family protein [Rhodospirillales bacterium]|jgi:xanthine dehydrogenase accessory factor
MSYLEVLEKSRDLILAHKPFCLVTIVDGRGSIPQIMGGRAIFTAEGLMCGTVGGGRLEQHCQNAAIQMLAANDGRRSQLQTLNLSRDLGMTCGGEVTVFFECHGGSADWTIALFGAGHVGQALCRLLVTLDCRVVVFDNRPDWLAALPSSPRLSACLVDDFTDGVARIPAGADILLMTIGHHQDLEILKILGREKQDHPYIGVIGSKSKAASLRKRLGEDGLPASFIEALVCPVGEKLGDNSPPEIALGIASQLLKRRRGTA